jgi:class 3 adenylate cyclase
LRPVRLAAQDAAVDFVDTHYARTADGAFIAYQVRGEGPLDFVWLSGFPSAIEFEMNDPVTRAWYDAIAPLGRIIFHDRRGTGSSSRNVPAPNLETRVADLGLVLGEVGAERPIFLPVTEVGAVSVLFAAANPGRAHSIVWLEPMARSMWSPDYPWGYGPEDVEADEEMTRIWEREGSLAFAYAFLGHQESRHNSDFSPDPDSAAAAFARMARNTCTPDVVREFNRIWYETDVRAVLPAVQTPTLLMIHGDRPGSIDRATYHASLMSRAEVRAMPGDAWTAEEAASWAEEIRRFIGAEAPPAEIDSVLSTILFTDIVGSTEKQASLGDHGWKQLIERHHTIVRDALRRWRGVENDTAGDGFYATFDGPARAIRCALGIAEGVQDLGIEIRAGVHTGECEIIDDKLGGISVTIGARVASHAGPSQVLVSQTVKDLVAGSGFTFEAEGEHELKGVPDRWRLYSVIG